MTQKSKTEVEPVSETVEEAEETSLPSKPKSKKGLIVTIILLWACVGAVYYGAPLAYEMLNPPSMLPVKSLQIATPPRAAKMVVLPPIVKASAEPIIEPVEVMPEPEVKPATSETMPEMSERVEAVVEEKVTEPVMEPVEVMPEPEPEVPAVVPEAKIVEKPAPVILQHHYTVLKAIQLREALKQEGECRPLLEELIAIPNKTPEMEQALMNLLQACLDRPVFGQMRQTFYTAKKRAILRIFRNDYPIYWAYLKSLPYFLADIHCKNPVGDAPMDVLDQLQRAVEEDRPQLVLELIPQLPKNVQPILSDVQQYATQEVNLYRTFNRLMSTLFTQGGNND